MRRPAFLAPLALLLGSLAACGTEPAPTPPPTASTVVAPTVGACHRVTYAEVLAEALDSSSVDCSTEHTAETIAVGSLPLRSDGHVLDPSSTESAQYAKTQCTSALAPWLGATDDETSARLRLTSIRAVWFTPAEADIEAGATWYRCDVIVVEGSTLATATGSLQGLLGTDSWRDYAVCGTAAPDATDFTRVLCREQHSWRAFQSVDVPAADGGGYPGTEVAKAAGQDVCKTAAQAVASNALDFQWGYEWPTQEQWTAGQTWGFCWAPDTGSS